MDWENRIVEQKNMAPGDLPANPGNWRKHPRAQAQALDAMLGEVGTVQGVIYNRRTERLVDGHLRVDLAKKQKTSTIPVTIVDLSEEEERLVLATLDPIGAMATHDEGKLRDLLGELAGEHDRAIACVLDDLARRVPKEKPKEREGGEQTPLDAVAEKWQVQPGDLWAIPSIATEGKAHRILCGDSTKEGDVQRLMGDERAMLFATDPPHAIDYTGKRYEGEGKDWTESYNESEMSDSLIADASALAARVALEESAAWYCWHDSRRFVDLMRLWDECGTFFHQLIVWVKPRSLFCRTLYRRQHEPCAVGWKKGRDPRSAKGSPNPWKQSEKSTVWEYPAPSNRGLHPTMKPVELFEIPMEMHTLQGELCYEPFSGSGTQLIAAERMGRICYAMEISPPFVAVALERLSELGLEPQKA